MDRLILDLRLMTKFVSRSNAFLWGSWINLCICGNQWWEAPTIFVRRYALLLRMLVFEPVVKAWLLSSGVRRKFSWGGVHSVACGGHLYLVFAVCDVTIWRHIRVSKSMFSRNWLTQYAYSSIRTLLNLCVTALNLNSQRSRLRYRRKISSTLRHSSSS